MKKLLVSLALAIGISNSFGQADQTYTTNNMSSGIATITTAPGLLTTFTAFTTNTSPSILYLYDGPYLITSAAWTNYTQYVTNVVTTYITSTGITNTLTNIVLATAPVVHPAQNGVVRTPIMTFVVPPASIGGGITTLKVNPALQFGQSLTFSNSAIGLGLTATYRNWP